MVTAGVRRHLPTHATDLCARFVEQRPVSRTGLTATQASSFNEQLTTLTKPTEDKPLFDFNKALAEPITLTGLPYGGDATHFEAQLSDPDDCLTGTELAAGAGTRTGIRIATHNPRLAAACDRVLRLEQGKLRPA